MPRAIWSGSISLGLVNVPVKLYSAVSQKDIGFHQLDENGSRIRYKRVSERTGRGVPYEKVKRGYEISRDRYVVFEPDELEQLRPEATRMIDIEEFVDLSDIDPIYYEQTYYLAPQDGRSGAAKAYRLLVEAMGRKGKVAIGRVVLRTKQYLAVLRPSEGALVLSTMLFADEVVPMSRIHELDDGEARLSDRELRMASQIIDSLSTEGEPERYHDTYREQVIELVERKAKGETVEAEKPERSRGDVLDLMSALEASLAAAGGGSAKRGGSTQGRRRQRGSAGKSKSGASSQERSSGARRRSA